MCAIVGSTWRYRLRLIGLCLAVLVGGGGGQALYGQVPGAAPADAGGGAPDTTITGSDAGTDDRAIVEADSLSALTRRGMRLQELFDNVQVRQDSTRLRSDFALRYLERDELLFTGNVVIYERGDTLRADTVRYNKRTKVGRARSNVRLTDGDVVARAPRATYYTEEKRSVFPDSVVLVDSTRVLQARSGTYWSNERRAEFQGNVRLTDPETHMTADSLTYYRDRERSIARGRVSIRRVGQDEDAPDDTTTRTYLFGEWVDNQEQNQFSRVRGEALLVRIRRDSAGGRNDTLIVRGRRLDAHRTDSRRRLVALDSVRVWERDLAAVADSMVYDRIVAVDSTDSLGTPNAVPTATAPQRPSVSEEALGPDTTNTDSSVGTGQSDGVDADTTRQAATVDSAATDSVEATSEEPATADAARWRGPSPRREEALPLEETRLFREPMVWFDQSQVWGDSIRVRAQQRTLDTVFVRGNAFAAQRDDTLDRKQQLKGQHLTAFFRADSLRRIEAGPTARAIRFLKTDAGALKGAAEASGDRIVLRFRDGSVRRTSIIGGVESTYHRTPEAVPTPFHLKGFRWVPERRPTKKKLLREPRVRAQFGLPTDRSPPLARGVRSSAAVRKEGGKPVDSSKTRKQPPPVPPDSQGRPPSSPDPLSSDSLQSSLSSP